MTSTWQEIAHAGMMRHLDLKPEFLTPGERITKEVKKGITFTLFRSTDPHDLRLYARFFKAGHRSLLPMFSVGIYSDNGRVLTLFDD